jgi:vacuolar protein sorting-associated protein 18
MEILDDCGNESLRIEDILPLFPDFETIDQFKKPIIKSLDRYNERLNDLRNEMNDASKSIDDIRDDLAKYRTRCVATIDSNETCSLCDQALMLQSIFYIFACGHHYHGDCLFTYVRRLVHHKSENQSKENQRSQASTTTSVKTTNERNKSQQNTKNPTQKDIDVINRLQSIIASGIAPQSRDMESVQQELDDLVASHCVLCGEVAVDLLDQPLDDLL